MIRHLWSVICTRSLVDQATNTLSLIDVIEDIAIGGNVQFPITIPLSMYIVTTLMRDHLEDPCSGRLRWSLFGPDGESAEPIITPVDLRESVRTRVLGRAAGLPLKAAGPHEFVVALMDDEKPDEWTEVARVPLLIRLQEPGSGSKA